MNTRRGFFRSLGVCVAAVMAAPKALLRHKRQSKYFVPNPAWVNAPYEIRVWGNILKGGKFPENQGLTIQSVHRKV